jgi:hypothetical protein
VELAQLMPIRTFIDQVALCRKRGTVTAVFAATVDADRYELRRTAVWGITVL